MKTIFKIIAIVVAFTLCGAVGPPDVLWDGQHYLFQSNCSRGRIGSLICRGAADEVRADYQLESGETGRAIPLNVLGWAD